VRLAGRGRSRPVVEPLKDRFKHKAMEELPEGAAYQISQTLFGSMIGTLNHNYQLLRACHGALSAETPDTVTDTGCATDAN